MYNQYRTDGAVSLTFAASTRWDGSDEAAVEEAITPATVSPVQVVRNPPKVRITSDGIGGKMVSTRIRSPIPG